MTGIKFRQFNDPGLLRSINPKRLREFLLGFTDHLDAHGFAVPSNDEFSDVQVAQLIAILNSASRSAPPEFLEAFFHANELNNDQGMESLLLAASKHGVTLPGDEWSAADLAMFLWIEHPEIVRRANCERIVHRFQSFQYYQNRLVEVPDFSHPTAAVLKQIQSSLDTFNRDRHRGGGSDVWMYDFGDDVAFLLRHGRPIVRDEVMHNDRPRPDVRRSVGYDLVVYNVKTGELRVRAESVRERRFYCQLFGTHLFDDPGFFPHAEMFDLEPINDKGEDIQAVVEGLGIEQVSLIEIRESLLGENTLTTTYKANEVFAALKEHHKRLSPNARLLHARFRFWFTDGQENTVTIYAGNILRSTRQNGLDIIHQWMLHHGIKTRTNETLPLTSSAPLADHLANPKPSSAAPIMASRTG